jgi:DNA-binding beta-propeller fold protein YncE
MRINKLAAFILTFLFIASLSLPAYAGGGVPYLGYTYDYWGNVVPSPAAYVPTISIGARDVDPSLGAFRSPEDMFVDRNGDIYLLDTGNDRVVIFDRHLNLRLVIDSFERDGSMDGFNSPYGISVSNSLEIYIADTENRRIVVLDSEGKFVKLFENPQYDSIDETFIFLPVKVAVDPADRVYAIVRNVYEGIMCFDKDGTFFGYFGTVSVNFNRLDWIWRQLATREQRARQRLFIPVEFSSMDIDADGFVYTTNIEISDENKIKRLNPSGEDVLINYTELNIIGDQRFRPSGRLGGRTSFVDIKARPYGMYSALDAARGRLFTYDSEGNLLYIISGAGNVLGMGRFPTAVEVLDGSILILDRQRGEIVYFAETEYGRLINEAISLRFEGDEKAAVEKWEQVLLLNENYTLAYSGIGKALLASGDNREAMDYLRKGMSVDYYSIAFRRYRNDVMKENMNTVLTVLAFIGAVWLGYTLYKASRRRKARLEAEIAENEARSARLKKQQER